MTTFNNKPSILIVDDTPNNIAVLVDYLSDTHFKVLVARDGESAIAQAKYAQPDLILLDVLMPGIDGFETCARLKNDRELKDIPVIFMTALSETVDKVKGFNAGAADYITKPLQHEEVLARINMHLALRRLQKSLEEKNAYLEREITAREQADEALHSILRGTASVVGDEFFHALVRHLAAALRVRYAFVAEFAEMKTRVRTLAFWRGNDYLDNFAYDLAGTPCEEVIAGNVCSHPSNVQTLFPRDKDLVALQAESYLGVPLADSSGIVLGHLAVLDLEPMTTAPRDLSILRIFAARAAVELERKRAELALQEANDRLEQRVLKRTAELTVANAQLQSESRERKRTEEELRAIVEGTAATTGAEFFHSLVKHLAETFHVRYAFVTECLDPAQTEVRTVAFSERQRICENISYALEDTPCEKVIRGETYYQPEKLYATFPKEAGMEAYLGIPIRDSKGQIIGHMAILHDQPLGAEPRGLAIMKIFAARAGAELERKRAEEALQKALRELEALKNRLQAENVYLQEEIKTEFNFEEIIGHSPAIKKVFLNINKVAPTDSTVLVTGETGTGKELVARAIHTMSHRKDSALIKVNCAALPSGLIESELFGHEKGAFTGATTRKKGRFELADGGTLFLDEVGELPLETQVKLLRVLQEQEFERVGGAQTLKVNVRVIAATNRDPEEAVKQGSFRADLFYRLNIFPIHLPALRERREDIPLLAHHFVGKFARRMGKRVDRIFSEALDMLTGYDWPGNVREMANLLERAVILCDGGEIQKEHIAISPPPTPKLETALPTLEEAERSHILKALEESNWVVGGVNGAAQRLGLNRTTLLARIKKLGLEKGKA